MIEKIKKDIPFIICTVITIILYIVFMELVFSELCIIKALFKINCPGCGLTHAAMYLFTGNIAKAIESNYSIFFWIISFILFFLDRYIHKLNKYVVPVTFGITAAVTIARYILLFIK